MHNTTKYLTQKKNAIEFVVNKADHETLILINFWIFIQSSNISLDVKTNTRNEVNELSMPSLTIGCPSNWSLHSLVVLQW